MQDIVVDVDGTLANIEHRLHFIKNGKKDWDAFFEACDLDEPIRPICHLVRSLHEAGNIIIFCSGRAERVRAKTQRWLEVHTGVPQNQRLYMRADGDHRPDHKVKLDLLDNIRMLYRPTIAIDDRQQVVDMWRAQGLICMQVAEGDF